MPVDQDAAGSRRGEPRGRTLLPGQRSVVHIADTTAHAVRQAGHQTVGLLATAYTMEQEFYVGRLRGHHRLDVVVPDEADRRIVHDVIYDELCLGRVIDSSLFNDSNYAHDVATINACVSSHSSSALMRT